MPRWAIRTTLMSSLLVLGACSTIPSPESRGGGTMRDVYDRVTQGEQSPSLPGKDRARDQWTDYNAYTRSVETETQNLFPRLPNPMLYMYVRPRAVGEDGLPVPGYTVPFTM